MNLDNQDWTYVKLDHEKVLKEMTLPDERYRAVLQTERFLKLILSTPRVPKTIKDGARHCLRHYPSEYDMKKVSQTSADIFAERMEDVSRLFKQYEEGKKNET
jgi:hypothetical protein